MSLLRFQRNPLPTDWVAQREKVSMVPLKLAINVSWWQ